MSLRNFLLLTILTAGVASFPPAQAGEKDDVMQDVSLPKAILQISTAAHEVMLNSGGQSFMAVTTPAIQRLNTLPRVYFKNPDTLWIDGSHIQVGHDIMTAVVDKLDVVVRKPVSYRNCLSILTSNWEKAGLNALEIGHKRLKTPLPVPASAADALCRDSNASITMRFN